MCMLLMCVASASADSRHWLKNKYKVKAILGGDQFSVDFNGMALVVKLVSVKINDDKGAKDILNEKLKGEKITIIPEESAGVSPEGFQLVYAIVQSGSEKIFINEHLIKEGYADHVHVSSKMFAKLQAKLKAAQGEQKGKKGGSGATASDESDGLNPNSKVCSELYSRKYHLLNCRWAKMINPQSRIIYDGFAPAEKAKKMPCSHCLYDRVKEKRKELAAAKKAKSKSSRKGPASSSDKDDADTNKPLGGLIGIKSDNSFYSPVSKKLQQLTSKQFIIFSSLKEARASGRRPDPGSLRIDNPVVPSPEPGECIGRALPYLRPCRRDAGHETGLCTPCLNGRIR